MSQETLYRVYLEVSVDLWAVSPQAAARAVFDDLHAHYMTDKAVGVPTGIIPDKVRRLESDETDDHACGDETGEVTELNKSVDCELGFC